MQNRFVICDIPVSINRLPKAKDSLRDLVEENSCWVDRFAFLTCNSDNDDCCVAAVELHIENVRDKAIATLDGMIVSMDEEGNINNNNDNDNGCISFKLHARPASILESTQLVQLCPIESDDVENESQMEKQTLKLLVQGKDNIDTSILLTIRKSITHGGIGTYPWRGGLILANQICHWVGEYTKRKEIDENNYFSILFGNNKTVLELGAGSSGLPSLFLGKIISGTDILEDEDNINVISTDGVDEIVQGLSINVLDNILDECIIVKHIDWNHYINCDEKKRH